MSAFRNIADYLRQRRVRSGLSQEQLMLQLVGFHSDFAELDTQAVSRWERGVVCPSLRRQVLLMQFFADAPYDLLRDAAFDVGKLPSLVVFDKLIDQTLDFRHIQGAHPYIDRSAQFDKVLTPPADPAVIASAIVNYQAVLSRGRECWDSGWLIELMSHPSCELVYYQVNGMLAGHLLSVRLKPEVMSALLRNGPAHLDIDIQHLAAPSEQGSLYALNAYAGSKPIMADHVLHLLRTVAGDSHCAALGFKARTEVGFKLFSVLDALPVALGGLVAAGREGVRYRGKRYDSVSFELDRQRVLSSALFICLVRRQMPQ